MEQVKNFLVHAPNSAYLNYMAAVSSVSLDVAHTLSLHLDGMGKSILLGVFSDNVEPQETMEITADSAPAATRR